MSIINSVANAMGLGGTVTTGISTPNAAQNSVTTGATIYPGGIYTATGTGTSIFPQFNSHEKVNYLNGYCKGIGWSLEHHYLPEGVSSTDGKIAILKISPVGEIIKDVGFKADEHNYYVMREPT